MIREFGQQLTAEDRVRGKDLLEEARRQISGEFRDKIEKIVLDLSSPLLHQHAGFMLARQEHTLYEILETTYQLEGTPFLYMVLINYC